MLYVLNDLKNIHLILNHGYFFKHLGIIIPMTLASLSCQLALVFDVFNILVLYGGVGMPTWCPCPNMYVCTHGTGCSSGSHRSPCCSVGRFWPSLPQRLGPTPSLSKLASCSPQGANNL